MTNIGELSLFKIFLLFLEHDTVKFFVREMCKKFSPKTYTNGKNFWSRCLTKLWFGILVFLFIALMYVFFADNLDFFFEMFGITSKARLIEILGITIAGNILLIQATVSYRRAVTLERSVVSQVEANIVLDRGNRQERFNCAIDHLGSKSSTVRLSAGFELFDLATNYEDLRQSIFSILCAHIRETTTQEMYQKQYSRHPSEEIQSLLTVLFFDGKELFQNISADLRRCWLRGANFGGASLVNAKLDGANLEHAQLHNADFRMCSFNRSKLRNLFCSKTMLQNSRFERADLRNAHLFGLMQGASLNYAKLDGAVLSRAKLQGAFLIRASLKGASLDSAYLHGANLVSAQLQGAFLGNTQFQGAELAGCDMRGVLCDEAPPIVFFEEHMRDRCDCPSDLAQVRFKGGLTQADVDEAVRYLSDSRKKDLIKLLSSHLGPKQEVDPEYELNIEIGEYSKEDLELWVRSDLSSQGDPED